MAGFFYIFSYAPTRITPGLVVHPYYSPGPEASWQSGTLPHAEAEARPYTKSINTQPSMTNFQSVISEAQPSNLERIKSSATVAVTFFISSVAHGYAATYNLIEATTFATCDWVANFVAKIYDMTH